MKLIFPCILLLMLSCQSMPDGDPSESSPTDHIVSLAGEAFVPSPSAEPSSSKAESADASIPVASVILARKQVPILCYHQIRDWKPTDSKISRTYIVPPAAFAAQMRMLADSGYHTISPDQLYNYLISGTKLPAKTILLRF